MCNTGSRQGFLQKLFTEKTNATRHYKEPDRLIEREFRFNHVERSLTLRRQISDILKNRNATNTDLKKARELIAEYQERIEEMKAQNTDLETERTRLNGVLTQLNDEMKGLQDNVDKITQENKALNETINEASTLLHPRCASQLLQQSQETEKQK
jgi:chromosome segregation ATPase